MAAGDGHAPHLTPAHVHLQAPLYEVLHQLDVLGADFAPLGAQPRRLLLLLLLLLCVAPTALSRPCTCWLGRCCWLTRGAGNSSS